MAASYLKSPYASYSSEPYLLKFPVDVRLRIYDFVLDKETLDPYESDFVKHLDHPSLCLMFHGIRPKQFFRYLHINQAIRADIIELALARISVTIELDDLVCILQVLTLGMRTNIRHLRLVCELGDLFTTYNAEYIHSSAICRFPSLNLSHHEPTELDLRYIGLKDLLHTYRGLPYLETLVLYPLTVTGTGTREDYCRVTLQEFLDFKVTRSISEFRRLRSFSIDYNYIDRPVPECRKCDCHIPRERERQYENGLLHEAEPTIRAAVEGDASGKKTF